MALQLVIAKGKNNVLSVYTPQTGCTDDEKDTFWRKLDEVLQSIPANEKVVLAGDIKLMYHTMKLRERIIENMIREIVDLGNIQFGFRKRMSTTKPIFALRILQKYQ